MMEVVNGNFVIRRFDGKPASGRDPVALEPMVAELAPDDRLDGPLPKGTKLGRVHPYAGSIADSMLKHRRITTLRTGTSKVVAYQATPR